MHVKVLKAFPWSPNGYETRQLNVGDVVNIQEDLVPGLAAEGLITEAGPEEVQATATGETIITAPMDIPADWRSLSAVEIRSLAAAIAGHPVANKTAAVAIIEAELTDRMD